MTDAISGILRNYRSQPPGVQANLYRLLNSGRLAGSGKLVILPVDQGFEHGPARSFSDSPDGYDPHYHYRLWPLIPAAAPTRRPSASWRPARLSLWAGYRPS